MKFSWKVFVTTVVIVAASFAVGGYILISSVFNTALEREVELSVGENRLLCFSFQTAAANVPQGDEKGLSNEVVTSIAQTLSSNGSSRYDIRISDSSYKSVYSKLRVSLDNSLMRTLKSDTRGYQILSLNGQYFIHTASKLKAHDSTFYLESLYDITSLFSQQDDYYATYRWLTLGIVLLSSVFMLVITRVLTRPIRYLSQSARQIAGGDYHKRTRKISDDEMGQLTEDFNTMAQSLESKIEQLQDTARQREEFVASFAHELKTPLTAIIGYADMLRSYDMDKKKQRTAANYIFTEGKRLESLSLKLLELIVLQKKEFVMQQISVPKLLEEVAGLMAPSMEESGLSLFRQAQPGKIKAEPDLLKTLLINLIDNARKASKKGDTVELCGEKIDDGYRISVSDNGYGIPKEEIDKITEAFYMVDKSRARAQNGAGLGLAICVQIASLHRARLSFDSELCKGTTVTVTFVEDEA